MSLTVKCRKCGNDLEVPGALLFGPPDEDGYVPKWHLCIDCFREVAHFITGLFPMVDSPSEGEPLGPSHLSAEVHHSPGVIGDVWT